MYVFQSPRIQAAYEKHLSNPDRLELDGELALIRTCLEGVVARISAADTSELSPESVQALVTLSQTITEVVDTITRVKKTLDTTIQVEQLVMCVEHLAGMLVKYVPQDKHEALFEDLRNLAFPTYPGGSKMQYKIEMNRLAHPEAAEKAAQLREEQRQLKNAQRRAVHEEQVAVVTSADLAQAVEAKP